MCRQDLTETTDAPLMEKGVSQTGSQGVTPLSFLTHLKVDDFRGCSAIHSSSHSCTVGPCLFSHSSLRMAYRYSSPHFPLTQTFWKFANALPALVSSYIGIIAIAYKLR